MVQIRHSRVVNGALGLVTAGMMLATPLAVFAQSSPNPQNFVPGPDAAGSGWTLQLTAGDTTSWVSIYGPADTSDKVTNVSAGVKIFPTADAVAKDFADTTTSMQKAGYTVTDVPNIGDKAVKVSGSVGNKKTAESFYLFAIGTTMGGVSAQTTPAKFNDVDQVAVNVANAELNLVRNGGQGAAAPAQATPGGLAKALAVPINAVGDGWASQNEKLDPNGKTYTVDFQPTDGTKQLASVGVWVLDTPDQVDALINQLADPLRQQGWAITPQDTYGDHTGLKGTLGSADAAGSLYLMGVGNRVALVLSVAPTTNAQDASDMADGLASVQEGRLY